MSRIPALLLLFTLTAACFATLQTRPPGLDPAGARLAQLEAWVQEAEKAITDKRLTLENENGKAARDLLDRVLRTDPFHHRGLAAMGRLIDALIDHAESRLALNPSQPETARDYWRKARDLAVSYRVEAARAKLDELLAAIETLEQRQAADRLQSQLEAAFAKQRDELEEANKRLREQLAEANSDPAPPPVVEVISPRSGPELRPKPLAKAPSWDEVKHAFQRLKLWSANANPQGEGYPNNFERKGKVVVDHASGLMWQQGGSPGYMFYQEALAHVQQLRDDKFAGYDDWRLPTVEEAGSLLEPSQLNGDLYIDPLFDKTQQWIWTADANEGSSAAWGVPFLDGRVSWLAPGSVGWVRACRSSG